MTNITIPTTDKITKLDQRQARLAWSLIAEPGDHMVNLFIAAHDGDAAAALDDAQHGRLARMPDATVGEITTALERWRGRVDLETIVDAIQKSIQFDIAVVIPGDPEWPTVKLGRLADNVPIVLYVRGDAGLLNRPEQAVAVVGARASTSYGSFVCQEFTSGLVERNVTIISCGSYGTDATAHRAALAGRGRTIAVLGGGIDRFFPSGNEELLRRVVEAGAVVSELPVGASPTKNRFLARNRIVAALSDAVLVPEAGWRSGALDTVAHARAMGISVGVVPGPINSAASSGCHRLLRESAAVCVTSTDEAFELLAE